MGGGGAGYGYVRDGGGQAVMCVSEEGKSIGGGSECVLKGLGMKGAGYV